MNYETGKMEGDQLLIGADTVEAARRRRRRFILIAVGLLVAAAIAWGVFGRGKKDAGPARGAQSPSVSFVVPGNRSVDRQVTGTGTLAARREMPVGVAGEGGEVARVLVEPGQWVGAGQVLATIDRSVQVEQASSLSSQINVARADLTLAQAELERAQQLVDRGFISKADVQRRIATRDAAQARLRVAQAASGEQRARNARLDIRAPAAGLVLTRQVEPGQIVSSASGTLFRMAKGGEMEMRVQLAETDLQTIRVGARAQVTPVGGTQAFAGQVWQVSPVIDPQTRQGIARVALSYDPALRPGGFATAAIASAAGNAPELPQSALLSDTKGNYVYIIDSANKVQRRDVTLGPVDADKVVIASGLTGRERVVRASGAFLAPGQVVKPVAAPRTAN